MKLSEFILLSETDKKSAIMNKAVGLAQRTYGNQIVFLFQLENYYVEAYCNVTSKAIEEYCILPDTNSISHYLESIPIDELLN
ncbi:MAG: hypothetical protein ACTHJ5_06335 [Ilyomonas sp.]